MEKEMELSRTLKLEDLKALAGTPGPCITFLHPGGRSSSSSLKKSMKAAEQALAARQIPPNAIRELLDPVASVFSDDEQRGPNGAALTVVLRSQDILRAFDVQSSLDGTVHVADHFQIRPVLQSINDDGLEFYVLALSQNHVRLLRCTHHESTEVELPKAVPASLEEWLNTRSPNAGPDHGGGHASEPGSTAGSFTSTTDRDKKDEHLANFYRAVNRGVADLLKGQTMPMILCGVDYELTMYQSINTYPALVEKGVHGSPESLKGGEMHKRALEIAREHAKEPMKKALAIYEKLGGTERVSAKPEEILKAAHEGRVAYLFLGEGSTFMGKFDPEKMSVRQDGSEEDLINLAALRTIEYGGEVWTTAPESIPEQAPMAAIFRF